jgi:gamma-glutamylcyclotransferase (GGCT)/AIG2-like uncharacterized protein YtfP
VKEPKRGHVILFQYGSNMSPDRLNGSCRLNGQATPISGAKLDGWGIRFDLYSKTNDSAVTDIVPAPGEHVLGVLFDIPESALAKMDEVEGVRPDGTGNYQRAHVKVTPVPDSAAVAAVTYVSTEAGRKRFAKEPAERKAVKPAYFQHLLDGAQHFNFAADYVAYLRRQAGSQV